MDPSKLTLCLLLKYYCNESIPPKWVENRVEDEVCNILTKSSEQLLPKTLKKLVLEVKEQFDVDINQARAAVRWACKYKGLIQSVTLQSCLSIIFLLAGCYRIIRCLQHISLSRCGWMGTVPRVYYQAFVCRFKDITRFCDQISCIGRILEALSHVCGRFGRGSPGNISLYFSIVGYIRAGRAEQNYHAWRAIRHPRIITSMDTDCLIQAYFAWS